MGLQIVLNTRRLAQVLLCGKMGQTVPPEVTLPREGFLALGAGEAFIGLPEAVFVMS